MEAPVADTAKEISEFCELAGLSAWAAEYILRGFSSETVLKHLASVAKVEQGLSGWKM